MCIAGIQDPAGRTTATVAINSSDHADNRLTAEQARELAVALTEAAARINGNTSGSPASGVYPARRMTKMLSEALGP